MSDNLRIRLEFRGFIGKDLRNSLLSFKRSQTKDVQSLELLIQKRFSLDQNFSIFIDNFILERTEPIDILRDNDLIVVEPKASSSSLTNLNQRIPRKPKDESKPEFIDQLVSKYLETKPKIDIKSEVSSEKKIFRKSCPKSVKIKSKQYISSDDDSNDPKTPLKIKPNIKSESILVESPKNRPKTYSKIVPKSTEVLDLNKVKTEMKIKSEEDSKVTEELAPEVMSNRDIPQRKAFRSANTSMKRKPQNIFRNASTSETPTSSGPPKPKRKKVTKEATEPVDSFSPIIILERTPNSCDIPFEYMSSKCIQKNGMNDKKQSARKTFPNPQKNLNNNNNTNNAIKVVESVEKVVEKPEKYGLKSIDCDNCETMTTLPSVGDIIAFKMLTLSSDGNAYESSPFNKGSVISVNKDNEMVDILLSDVIKRKNINVWNKVDEQMLGIHTLKINWSTVLEPKLIQRAIPEILY